MTDAFLAVDWGTTNRRIYVIEDGEVALTERDDQGALRTSDYPQEMAEIRKRHGDLPALLAGMVGSNIGWCAVPYVPTPAGLPELATALTYVEGNTAIVPGLSLSGDARFSDVMRGEEVQLLGAIESGVVCGDTVLCQPGTHCKWAWVTQGRISRFTTSMTGELFALLRSHSLLAPMLASDENDLEAFREGVRLGSRRDLAASLFSIRANHALGKDKAGSASFASGLLIGADVAARLEDIGSQTVHILADEVMGGLYVAAITELGGQAVLLDSHSAFVSGISTIRKLTQ